MIIYKWINSPTFAIYDFDFYADFIQVLKWKKTFSQNDSIKLKLVPKEAQSKVINDPFFC